MAVPVDSMTDSLRYLPSGSLDDHADSTALKPADSAVLYTLQPKGDEDREKQKASSNFWSRLPFLRIFRRGRRKNS